MSTDHRPRPPGPTRPSRAGSPSARLRVHDPGELIAAVPHLLGFTPEASIVLVAVHGRGRRRGLGVVARADLPAPGDVDALAAGCATPVAASGPQEVMAIVVAEPAPDGEPPRPDVVAAVGAAFGERGIPVRSRLWVPRIAAGVRWRCYPPCDCAGSVASPDDSPLAAEMAWRGRITHASRGEMEGSLAPAVPPRLPELVRAEHEAARLDRELGGPAAARRDLAAVVAARDEVAAGRPLGDEELARLAVALGDPGVRDTVMGWALDPDEAVADAAERLWTQLVRALPEPDVAEPAILLACALLVRGGSALVTVALDRALAADPGHRLTRLIDSLLASGMGPDALRTLVRESSDEAAAQLRGRAG
ncbi:hypothetical protein Acsp06_14260 [Actinomycetospora sp. NBRC 106375]|uniref:DUF4192 domain-containing protein n=1 Tax=Actinomycetospora sp. NBRC 106375 TaxID=3032207 RepID=UPI0024A32D10|nr:DUF4192 domain-containing protein [Actinomycetospora sp. NBRC 106375]GLZ45241.1 hypothetical protein Acsp06_14260 [Actinomycetospora sp. NBRC 106375]